jgi:hypothetical protein
MYSDSKLMGLKAIFILGTGNKWEYESTPSYEGINVTSISPNPVLEGTGLDSVFAYKAFASAE